MARQLVVELIAEARRFRDDLNNAAGAATTFGERLQNTGKAMTAFVSVPILGFLGVATKAAMDDATAQAHLAQELKNSVGAHKDAAAAVEGFIGKAMKASTFSDDELRPAYESIVRSTKNIEESNRLLAIAMDVAASKGIPLEAAALAVTKAQEGQFAAANKLVPGLVDLKDKTLTAEAVTSKLAETFKGSASAATETAAGKMQNMNRDLGELTESIGTNLLPILTQIVDAVMPVVEWFGNLSAGTQKTIVIVGLAVAAIGPLIAAVGALTAVFWAFIGAASASVIAVTAIVAAAALLAAGVLIVIKNWDTFKAAGAAAVEWVTDKVKDLVDWLGKIPEKIGSIVNKIPGAGIIKGGAGIIGKGIGGVGNLLGFANGGVVPGQTGAPMLAVVHGGETVIPAGGGGPTVIQLMLDGQIVTEVVHDGLLTKQRQNRGAGLGFAMAAS